MLFDQRTRAKLREAGLDADALRDVEREVAAEARTEADRVEAFFADRGAGGDPDGGPTATVYSDMDVTHSSADYPEHEVRYVDLFTHSQDVRGWLRFDSWGAYVEGARLLSEDVAELTLGPTVHDRVRFASDREHLR